jgi:Na+/H+-dicarboxylate symporter
MKKVALHWQVIIALILGIVYSVVAVQQGWIQFTADYIAPLGTIFINVLKLIAVPMVLFSIISGITSLKNIRQLGRVGIKTLSIFLATTVTAILIGLLFVNIIKPGNFPSKASRLEKRVEYELWRSEHPNVPQLDNVHEISKPENAELVASVRNRLSIQEMDETTADKFAKALAEKKRGPLDKIVDVFPSNIFEALLTANMLQVIFFSIFFGVILMQIRKKDRRPVAKLVNGLNEVFVGMINAVIKIMPFFVFALMAGSLVASAGKDLAKLQEQLVFLMNYSWVLILGLVSVAFGLYPLLIHLFAKGMKFSTFVKGMSEAQLTAFSTSSSMATLPVTMECVHDNLKVPKSITSFVLPIGATVNMDGTSLYQAVAVVALAQFHMIELDFAQQMVIVLTATLASIGAAAVPSAGLVLMIVVLESVGLNPAWIAIILPVDRILDMCRTVVNVTGDAAVSVIVSETEDIEEI